MTVTTVRGPRLNAIRRVVLRLLFVSAALIVSRPTVAFAEAGQFDESYGGDGVAAGNVGMSAGASSIVVQGDGKIVLGGYLAPGGQELVLVRHLPNGDLDPSFGSGGKQVVNVDANVVSLALQSDGKIVAVRSNKVFRFLSDGTLDTTFGTGGIATSTLYLTGVALQSDGKIVATGIEDFASNGGDIGVERRNADGSLDMSFGTGGKVESDFFVSDYPAGLAIQGDGKIVVAGSSFSHPLVARYTAAGGLDSSCNGTGSMTISLSGWINGLALQGDGKIVVVGSNATSGSRDFLVARLTSACGLDPTFGSGGISPWSVRDLSLPTDNVGYARTVVIPADGKIVVVGPTNKNVRPSLTVVRFTSAGAIDAAFGEEGVVATPAADLFGGTFAALYGSDRLVVAGGQNNAGGVSDFTSARLWLRDSTSSIAGFAVNGGAVATSSTAVTLSITATDSVGSVADMSFSNDGGTWGPWLPYAPTTPWTLSDGEGPKTVYARVRDAGGNRSAVASDTIVYDADAPTISTFVVNGGAAATTSTSVTLTLQVSDTGGSGLSQMSFSNDGGATWSAWEPYAPTKAWTLSPGEGAKTVQAKVRDTAGNVSSPASDAITLDTSVGSSFGVSIDNAAIWTNTTSVDLSMPAPPDTAKMMISNDAASAGAQWEPYDAHKAWTLDTSNGDPVTKTVYVRFGDANGNELPNSRSSDTIILDVDPPTGSVAISNTVAGQTGAITIQSPVRALQLTASDSQSGAGMSMRLSNRADFAGAIWKPFAASATWDFTGGGTVYAQFKDGAGNVSQTYSQTLPGSAPPGTSPTVSCSPRPPVQVNVQKSNGTLLATLATTGASNGLRAVRFDTFSSASVDVGSQSGQTQPFAVSIPAGQEPALLQFTVRRTPGAQSATVRLVVIDGCGEWSTFVGGGPSAW